MVHAIRSSRPVAFAVVTLAFTATASAGPGRLPNTQRYRVTATATATGRTGSATMSARALIDRDGHAVLEAAAGDFETPPVGSLAKIQLKSYDGNGDLLYTQNLLAIDAPMVVAPLGSLDRGETLQVQGNIRNVDDNRTDVVTVTTVGRLRPDLSIVELHAPASARAGLPVRMSATIAELNHDTGARATCVLSVDDRAVDRAEAIWVDAGDTVSCAFSHVFATGGFHQLRVDVTDVNPGDWDVANNSAGASVLIITEDQPFDSVTASVGGWLTHYRSHNTGFSRHTGIGLPDYVRTFDFLSDQSSNQQGAQYQAYVAARVSFPLTQIVVGQWSDDTLVHAGVYTSVATTGVGPSVTCGRVSDDADPAVSIEVCTAAAGQGGNPVTSVSYSRYSGTVTYFSSQYDAAWYETPEGTTPIYEYSGNYLESHSTGSPAPLGDAYRFEVTLIDAGVSYSKPVTVPLVFQVWRDVNFPWRCQEFSDPSYGYKKICQEFIDYLSLRFGRVNWSR